MPTDDTPNADIDILNLGAGVQSTCVLLMSERGELPLLDHAIFADTGWEPPEVYENLEWLKKECTRIPIHTVSTGNLRDDALSMVEGGRAGSMPLYVKHDNGPEGRIRRQCTAEYKIQPIERFIRNTIMGLPRGRRVPKGVLVRQWFGISADEIYRAKQSPDKWREYIYPLMTWLPQPYTRRDCEAWLQKHYPGRVIPRSACVGCPFHSDYEWRKIMDDPVLREDAVEFDKAIRNLKRMRGEVFLHRSCQPLDEVDMRTAAEKGQLSMFTEECGGYCGT